MIVCGLDEGLTLETSAEQQTESPAQAKNIPYLGTAVDSKNM